MIRYITACESHGPALSVIIEGVPAGVEISQEDIMTEMKRRKQGYGRGGRQQIETDEVEVLSGIRFGKTTGSPISMLLRNNDFANWTDKMSVFGSAEGIEKITTPRPGHADYAGMLKYNHEDIRNVLERSSARETAMRVAVGAICKKILRELGVNIAGYVKSIASVEVKDNIQGTKRIQSLTANSQLQTINNDTEKQMIAAIDEAASKGVSLGGKFVVVAEGMPVGAGSYVQWDRKLDANIAKAMISIQAIKAVEFGDGFALAKVSGDKAHDEFRLEGDNVSRTTNHAGGFEGGMTNGEPIVVTCAMKPIPTMRNALQSVDLQSKTAKPSFFERADVCAVPAATVVAENVLAVELLNAILEKFGADSLQELKERV